MLMLNRYNIHHSHKVEAERDALPIFEVLDKCYFFPNGGKVKGSPKL